MPKSKIIKRISREQAKFMELANDLAYARRELKNTTAWYERTRERLVGFIAETEAKMKNEVQK